MLIRETTEELEAVQLSPYAALSRNSKGRDFPEQECQVRTAFQRDRDRIIHSKSFRRLKHKTQVFIAPTGDHYRTRLTHTLEVAQIARTVAKALRLNEDLTEAIALGHDLGHTAFGHAGEVALDEIFRSRYGLAFRHNEQSLRVVEVLEKMNLTREVRDGILNHTEDIVPATLEGQIVKTADRIAYINHDIDDALRGGIITTADLPRDCLEVLGNRHTARINKMVTDMIMTSRDCPQISMSPEVQNAMERMREYLFDHVYIGSEAKKEEQKAKKLLQCLFDFFVQYPEELPAGRRPVRGDDLPRIVCDYVAGMTDRFALDIYTRHFLPTPWID